MEVKDKKRKTRGLVSNVRVGGSGLDTESLRSLALQNPETFMQRAQDLIDDGSLSWRKVTNLPRLFNALFDVKVEAQVEVIGQQRAVMASAFPLLSGGLTVAAFNAALEAVPSIGQDLVEEMDDNKKVTIIANIQTLNPDEERVDEMVDYPEIGAGEEKYEIRHLRNGRKLTISAETIEENDVANIVRKIDKLGEIAGEMIETQTLQRVTDHFGSGTSPAEPYVLRLNGTGTQLYNATAANPGARAALGTRVTNNALVDETDLEAARVRLAAMQNERGERISIPMSQSIVLVPDAVASVIDRIRGSDMTPGVENEMNVWGARGRHQPQIRTTPKLDDLSTSAWYLGDFKKQFTRKWKLRMEFVTLGGDTQAFLNSRIAFQARIGWDVEIGATDFVYVVQSLSGTTAPVDE